MPRLDRYPPGFFTADILLATVLRKTRSTDVLAVYLRLSSCRARGRERPAWDRTLAADAEWLGVMASTLS